MADYNIYIHSYSENTGGSGSEPGFSLVKPWSNQPATGGVASFQTFQNVAHNAEQIATVGFAPYINTGVAALGKVVPAIAIIYAVAKIADKIVTTGLEHVETYTGHYEYSMGWNNFKTDIANTVNPIGVAIKNYKRQKEYDLKNLQIEQERKLVGNSILTTSVRGV